MENKRLQTMLCVPGKHCPGDKTILAKVNDGKEIRFFRFGATQPFKQIWSMIPRLWMDSKFKPRKKAS